MSGTVCYLERATGGSLIRRVRLVSPGLDRSWIADAPAEPGLPLAPGAALAAARAAARWVAEQTGRGNRELEAVCVDPEGSLCLWLSAPSSSPAVIVAAMAQGKSSFDGDGAGGGSGSGGAETSPLAVAAEGVGFTRSVQALATVEGRQPGRRGLRGRAEAEEGDGVLQTHRMGVVSVADAPVRVFLDELDALGIEVRRVESLWHAIAAAWDPGSSVRRSGEDRDSDLLRDVASQSPCTAAVVVDPPGRLVWAWSSGGELLAGGTMRVLGVSPTKPAPAGGGAEVEVAGAAKRLVGAEAGGGAEGVGVLCGPAEVGRLVADWLAWGAQLGRSPTRILCVGPTEEPGGPGGSPTALAAALVRAWPGATVDAAPDEDPIGATLGRLSAGGARPNEEAEDPRRALITLTQRPGRLHRRFYHWAAAAILAMTILVGVLGWKLSAAAADGHAAAESLRIARLEMLAPLEKVAPGVSESPAPEIVLRSTLQKLQGDKVKIVHERPTLREFARVLEALEGREGVRLDEVMIYEVSGTVLLSLPENDSLTGPAVTQALQGIPGSMVWRGEDKRSIATSARVWQLTGTWPP